MGPLRYRPEHEPGGGRLTAQARPLSQQAPYLHERVILIVSAGSQAGTAEDRVTRHAW
jgi:hypothetical protein